MLLLNLALGRVDALLGVHNGGRDHHHIHKCACMQALATNSSAVVVCNGRVATRCVGRMQHSATAIAMQQLCANQPPCQVNPWCCTVDVHICAVVIL